MQQHALGTGSPPRLGFGLEYLSTNRRHEDIAASNDWIPSQSVSLSRADWY